MGKVKQILRKRATVDKTQFSSFLLQLEGWNKN